MRLTRNRSSILTLVFCLLIVGVVFIPLLLFFCFTMIPSALIFFVDRSPEKIKTKALTVLNFIGSVHVIFYSLQNYESFNPLSVILADPLNWLIPYGLFAFGLGIFLTFPAAIEVWMSFWLTRRERTLRQRQEKLLTIWGRKLKEVEVKKSDDDLFS